MTATSRPFAEKKFTEVNGHRMAYLDEGEGAPIVFQHGRDRRCRGGFRPRPAREVAAINRSRHFRAAARPMRTGSCKSELNRGGP